MKTRLGQPTLKSLSLGNTTGELLRRPALMAESNVVLPGYEDIKTPDGLASYKTPDGSETYKVLV